MSSILELKAKLAASKQAAIAPTPAAAPVAQAAPSPAPLTALQQLQAKLKAATPPGASPAPVTPDEAGTAPALTALQKLQQALKTNGGVIPTKAIQKAVDAAPTASPLAQQLPQNTVQPVSGTGTAAIVQLNEQQLRAVELGRQGKSFAFIGSAGTGKTTTERELVRVIAATLHEELGTPTDKFKPSDYIIVCAFTRRAVRNTYKALSSLGDYFTACCKTVHKALEYKPVVEDYLNEEGEWCKKKIYKPHVTKDYPNTDTRIIIVDEASMLGYSVLYRQLREGFPNAIFVFVGDLNQLRPVMDDPTLAYALACLPVVELSQVYRQALDSPIIDFQYRFTLAGKSPSFKDLKQYNEAKNGLTFHAVNWPKMQNTSKYNAMLLKTVIKPSFEAGTYNPDDCVILIPYNKEGTFGAHDLNLEIAEFLGKARNAVVHEVIAGFRRKYLAVGDYVMFERRECEIIDIGFNSGYRGATLMQCSQNLSRHGYYTDDAVELDDDLFKGEVDKERLDFMLAQSMEEEDSATRSCSHVIQVRDRETGQIDTLDTNKDLLELEFSYAMTVHKSQGSEWRKVYFIVHGCHKNVSRELLYTGMTRAREECVVLYSKGHSVGMDLSNSSICKAIHRQEITGKTWQEKAAVYRMKLNNGNADIPLDMDWFLTEEDRDVYEMKRDRKALLELQSI